VPCACAKYRIDAATPYPSIRARKGSVPSSSTMLSPRCGPRRPYPPCRTAPRRLSMPRAVSRPARTSLPTSLTRGPGGRDVAQHYTYRSQAAAVPRYERQRLCGQGCACAVLRRNAKPRRVQMQYRKGARQRCNHSSHSDINYDVGLAAAVNTPLAPTMAIARKHCIPPASMAATVDRVDRSRRDAPDFEPTQQQPTRGCDVATHRSQPVAVRTRPSARAHQYAWL